MQFRNKDSNIDQLFIDEQLKLFAEIIVDIYLLTKNDENDNEK
jgi:hypothetical protein